MLPKRRSVRIEGYDYSQPGKYFVTLCTAERRLLFGHVAGGAVVLTPAGRIAEDTLAWLTRRYPHISIDHHIVMPNHVHAVISWVIRSEPRKTLGDLVGAYKATACGRMRRCLEDAEIEIWQRGLYEHIVEDEADLYEISEYIHRNAETWDTDRENPEGR